MRFGGLLRWAALTIVVVYVGLCGAIYAMQDRLLYFPDSSRPDPAVAGLTDLEVVALNTVDGLSLNGWYRAARPGARTIVLMHGNSGNIGVWGPLARPWLDAGLGVLLFDWRGYGGNAGTSNEAGLLDDGEAAMSFLAARGVPLERMALYGESLGSGIAVQLAARRKVGALILHAPYTSIAAVAADKFPALPVGLLIHDRFDALAAIGRVEARSW